MKIKFKLYTNLFFCFFYILGCNKNSLEDKLIGIWTVDINPIVIERNDWVNIYGNIFSLNSDFTCEVLPFLNGKTNEFYKSKGTWLMISSNKCDSLFFNVPDHPMNGKYKIELYKDIDKKLLKMKLSKDSIQFTCSKFLQNFDKTKDW